MKIIERQLIEAFTKIERNLIGYIAYVKACGKIPGMQRAEQIQQSVIALGEGIEGLRDSTKAVDGAESVHTEYVQHLNGIVTLLEEYCELLYSYATDYYDEDKETEYALQKKSGEIALAIRFDIKTESEEIFRPETFQEKVYGELDQANEKSGSLYKLAVHTMLSYWKYKAVHTITDVAIVSQGPIDYKDDFTAETMYYYRKLYPLTRIIISTWKGEVREDFRWKMESIGVIVLENEKPEEAGAYNVNMQIISTRNGIEKAAEDDHIKYIMKTRNDQRYYHPDFLQYLRNLIRQYSAGNKAEARLVYMGEPTSMFTIPFRLTDFMLFGTVGMMRDYWSDKTTSYFRLELSRVDHSNLVRYQRTFRDSKEYAFSMSKKERARFIADVTAYEDPETALVRAYYHRVFMEENTRDDIFIQYWKWLRDYVIIADTESMQWVWDKYEYCWHDHNVNDCVGNLNYFSWLDLYLNGLEEVEV